MAKSVQTFTLPDVGEGLTEAEIVEWRVAVGDEVAVNQVILDIETAKSLVELPSPYAGIVTALQVAEGDTVEVGTALISVETEVDAGAADAVAAVTPPVPASGSDEASGAVLVGYGTGEAPKSRRRRSLAGAAQSPAQPRPQSAPQPPVAPVPAAPGIRTLAKPPIRKLAKDLGVDISLVTGTGRSGEVTRDDVTREANQASVFRNIVTPPWSDDREERIAVKGVRKQIAHAMTSSAFTAPHVTVFVDVDATRTMEYVKRLKTSTVFAGVKVSPLLVMAKAIVWAVQRNPSVNSSFDESTITIHHYVNLGIAAATPRGLLVPNIKDAQSKSMFELAQALEHLTLTAREGKTQPADMAGGTITITNIGVFGVDSGTPILNPGEVAIVALGSIKQKPWVVDGVVQPRFVTTVAATFDHRVVDGDVASRFTADIASVLEEPALLLD